MNNKNKTTGAKRAVPIVLVILAIVIMLPVIISLCVAFLPVVIIALFGFLIFLLVRLFRKRKTVEEITPMEQPVTPAYPQTENEISITQRAFGLLQRRITEQIELEYPGARWVWSAPNAIERFKNNEPLIVLLSSAGGYNKAQVMTHNLLFKGMYYITLETAAGMPAPIITVKPEITAVTDDSDDIDDTDYSTGTDDTDNILPDDAPVNYGRLAFEWVDANMMDVNAKYNEAIAQNKDEMLIPAAELPHPDSWADVCEELKHNGFSVAEFCEDGIKVNITH